MPEQPVRSLLLIEPDAAERRVIGTVASRAGWTVIGADCLETAAAVLNGPYGGEVRVALLASWDPLDPAQSIESLRSCRPGLPLIVLADSESLAAALDAMRAGATDFLGRPVAPERLIEALGAAADRRRPSGELVPLAEKLAPDLELDQLIGATPEFRSALAIAAKAARNRLPILITGERGTGKETLARAIHAASLRSRGPLVAVDCKALAPAGADAALFGFEAGAFPGAFQARRGKMHDADGGTLLLDDIAALPPSTQQALDRALATGEVRPVGCNGSNSVDVRLVATSTGPLPEDFHAPLRERVMVTSVQLPPLRQRSSDIPALSRHLLARFAEQGLTKPLGLDNAALNLLMRFGWPGNVRQLASVLLRAGLESKSSSLGAGDFPHIASQSRFSGRAGDRSPSLSRQSSEAALTGGSPITLFDSNGDMRTLDEIEADIIRLAIGHYRGRMTEVARRLGIGRSTLYRKLGEIGIDTAA